LSSNENNISIEFVSLNFQHSRLNQYAYRLTGANDNWIDIGTKREVTFTNLKPGRYVFHVKASNNDAVWNEVGARLEIIVRPPWWATNLAYSVYTGIFIGLLYLAYRILDTFLHQKNEARRLKELSEVKSSFISSVSHELRTPLTSIMGFSKLIKKQIETRIFPNTDMSDPKTGRAAQLISGNIDIMISEGERLTMLINEVLDLAKIEAGKMTWHFTPFSITDLVERVIDATSFQVKDKHLMLYKVLDKDLPEINGDFDRLLQVLLNLVSNAVKFTEMGSITISVKKTAGNVLFSVKDTGKGIPVNSLDSIFGKFNQVNDYSLTDKPTGTGLGLPISKEIVEYHGGKIWVESEVGKGSVFYFTIPEEKYVQQIP
jgi:signal transduction histidine kinase